MLGTILGYKFMQKKVKYFHVSKAHIQILLKNVIYEIHHLQDTSSKRV